MPARSPSDPTADEPGALVPARAGGVLSAGMIRAALSGDPVAVSTLLSQIRPGLVRYCRARITPRSGHGSADDVAQETCIAVLQGLPAFAGEPHEVLRWVYGVAAHKVTDFNETGGRSDPTEHSPSRVKSHAGSETLATGDEQLAKIRGLLALLTPAQEEILTLRLIVGLSSADTAAVTGMSATAVRVTQHRALNRLRGHLTPPAR